MMWTRFRAVLPYLIIPSLLSCGKDTTTRIPTVQPGILCVDEPLDTQGDLIPRARVLCLELA